MINYQLARLKPLTRITFWSSLAVITVIGITFYQYRKHPELLQNRPEEITGNSVSVDHYSSLASTLQTNLNNGDVLVKEIQQNQVLFNKLPEVKHKTKQGKAPYNFNKIGFYPPENLILKRLDKVQEKLSPQSSHQPLISDTISLFSSSNNQADNSANHTIIKHNQSFTNPQIISNSHSLHHNYGQINDHEIINNNSNISREKPRSPNHTMTSTNVINSLSNSPSNYQIFNLPLPSVSITATQTNLNSYQIPKENYQILSPNNDANSTSNSHNKPDRLNSVINIHKTTVPNLWDK